MELLGENVHNFTREKSHDLAIVLEVAAQMIDRLQVLHTGQIVHCDIKPHNIAINHKTNQWCLFDFGMAIYSFKFPVNRPPLGTLLFMSRGAHNGIVEYKNDVESLAYSLIFIYDRNALPWRMSINAANRGFLLNQVKEEKDKFKSTLAQNLPYPLNQLVQCALNMQSNDLIDYDSLRKICRQKLDSKEVIPMSTS